MVVAYQTTEHPNQSHLPGSSLLMTFPQLGPIQSIPCLKHTQRSTLSESTHLNGSFAKELQSIAIPQRTAKTLQDLFLFLTRASSQSANVMNDNSLRALVDSPLSRTECEEGLYSTSTICDDVISLKNKLPEQEPLASSKSSLHRIESFSFSTKDSKPSSASVPSYMAMRKWKSMSSTSNASLKSDESCGFAKCIRQDSSSVKLLQKHRL